MPKIITCAIAQLNATVGDIEGNVARVLAARTSTPADILLAPEMMVTGYQLDDLVQVGGFFDRVAKGLDTLKQATSDGKGAIIIGAPRLGGGEGGAGVGGGGGNDEAGGMINNTGKTIYNSVFVFADGKQVAVSDKARLPLGGVFDDARNFTAGSPSPVVEVAGVKLGLPICEDFWSPSLVADLVGNGAEVIMTINGSPFERSKIARRHALAKQQAATSGVPVVYVNLIGGQDDVVFDGASFAVNPPRKKNDSKNKTEADLACQLPHAEEAVELVALHQTTDGWRVEATNSKPATSTISTSTPIPDEALLWEAICLGISDYVRKNNFSEVLLGLSGGIDSAVVATLAADALGGDKVHGVMMPSPYTSRDSLDDATALAKNLGIHLSEIAITPAMHAVHDMLANATAAYEKTNAKATTSNPVAIAQENIQSRLRGIILMALSNMSGGLVLTTGNKSEYASGYATLYGDMCGGYAPLIDVWKTQVFALAEWRNQQSMGNNEGGVIPSAILTKPPSAELRPDQKDSDSLPPYPSLDAIMAGLVEEMLAPHDLIAQGHEKAHVLLATALLKSAEFKRRQCAPGPKMSKRAFYRDRRFPITSAYNSGDKRT